MSTPTILEKIKAYKLREIEADKAERPVEALLSAAAAASPPRGFADALLAASKEGYGLIAEIKKASPSKGLIREDFDPATLARAYEDGGAACLSVLTDTPSFQGAKKYLTEARDACDLPVLRKDFMYDPYQVIEARALGADAILIVMASVTDDEAAALEETAMTHDMDVLVEVHNQEELDRAALLESKLLGINNRDLHTFETSLDVTRKLAKQVPAGKIIVCESGLNSPKELAEMAMYGARCFLIGESLMRQPDVTAATRAILADPLRAGGF
ncbi:indole-3-glycerol phosphate synthase TrpC [Roseovarius sp. SCSIO 43702]|uniref:indole-3-glycerol phosphate synthase TrpC n=1 Tax=Roseovarius sp. SCSIO 43702 TaxID=2823043 RepID=UPI001C73CDF9|nr:indole-3-glycerol phosphate synthase TrpC [Roseovarius sp. SCSIO 43702]QYX58365.1 indole-3-glycerol phosphate synthase TrpC [Roseovarius sp. SCSIO 43702]